MINNLQILRAFAALNVVLFHIISAAESYGRGTYLLKRLEGWGANGVDIFFVISGFVMLHTQLGRRRSPAAFFRNRVTRIAPIYWALNVFIITLFTVAPGLFREVVLTPGWALASLTFTSYLVFGDMPIVQVGWTLEWEMFFYTAFAVALFAKSMRTVVAAVVVLVVAASLATQSAIALEFLFGMGLAYLYRNWRASRAQGALLLVGGVFLLSLSLVAKMEVSEISRVAVWGVPAIAIVAGAIYSGQQNNKLLTYLGDASYSIYLAQALAIPGFYKAASFAPGSLSGDLIGLSCLMFSALVGCAIYQWVEKPITRYLKDVQHIDRDVSLRWRW